MILIRGVVVYFVVVFCFWVSGVVIGVEAADLSLEYTLRDYSNEQVDDGITLLSKFDELYQYNIVWDGKTWEVRSKKYDDESNQATIQLKLINGDIKKIVYIDNNGVRIGDRPISAPNQAIRLVVKMQTQSVTNNLNLLTSLKSDLDQSNIQATIYQKELLPTLIQQEQFLDITQNVSVSLVSSNVTTVNRRTTALAKDMQQLLTPSLLLSESEAVESSDSVKPTSILRPNVVLGVGSMAFHMDSARRNPVSVIHAFPFVYLQFQRIKLGYGMHYINEPEPNLDNDDHAGYLDYTQLNSHYFQFVFDYPLKDKIDLELGLFYLFSKGRYLGMSLEKANVTGIFLGIEYQLSTRFSFSFSFIPFVNNQWQYQEGQGDDMYDMFKGDKSLSTTHYGNMMMLGLNWNFKKW